MDGMTKLIHPAYMPEGFEQTYDIVEDPAELRKRASAAGAVFDYEALKPDDKHVGIHLVALGDAETFGQNRNGDCFRKVACRSYHDTFVKYGAVYRHHKAEKGKELGKVASSAYNEPMGRIELFIHADKEKAAPELEKMARDGEVSFSMSCRVPGDVCTVCNTFRKSAADPNQCEHVRDHLGQLMDDGRYVGTYNDEPRFFDISFVYRPADRIAWNLKAASNGLFDSISLAVDAGVSVPIELELSGVALDKLACAKRLARFERAVENGEPAERAALSELSKAAADRVFDDAEIDYLRSFEPGDAMTFLAQNNTVMDPASFCRYALGREYSAAHDESVKRAVAHLTTRLDEAGELHELCRSDRYDPARVPDLHALAKMASRLGYRASAGSADVEACEERALRKAASCGAPVEFIKRAECEIPTSDVGIFMAREYITYKAATAAAIDRIGGGMDDGKYAFMAVQSIVSTKK